MSDSRIIQLRMLQNSFFGNSTKGCSVEVYNKINDLIEKYKINDLIEKYKNEK